MTGMHEQDGCLSYMITVGFPETLHGPKGNNYFHVLSLTTEPWSGATVSYLQSFSFRLCSQSASGADPGFEKRVSSGDLVTEVPQWGSGTKPPLEAGDPT